MNEDRATRQRIGRLTPLADVLAAIAKTKPVRATEIAIAKARNCVLAADVLATDMLPPSPLALRDGWALDADATSDASSYAPLMLQPQPVRINAFAVLPAHADAVAPLDTAAVLGGMLQVMAPVAPGDGVLPAGGDTEVGARLRMSGARLRISDIAALSSAGVTTVHVRAPRLRIVNNRPNDPILDAATTFLIHAAESAGATTELCFDLDQAFRTDGADAMIAVGGTGVGLDDHSVIALSRAGTVTCHGIGLLPGETVALGTIDRRPVLLMPGRIDAVLACWLVLGQALIDRLSGSQTDHVIAGAVLTRKVTSAVGFADVVLLARSEHGVEPLASGYLSPKSLARADGWMLVPAGSEGYPPGATVEMRPLP